MQPAEEALHALRIHKAMATGLPEFARSTLTFAKFGRIEHEDGTFYTAYRGELDDPKYADLAAYFIAADGSPVYLAPVTSGPRTRAELEQHRADREARRNQPKPTPAWNDMTPEQAGEQLLRDLRRDPTGQLAETASELVMLDLEINLLQRVTHEERKARVEALGIDVSNYGPPPPLHPSELRPSHRTITADEIDRVLTAAQENPMTASGANTRNTRRAPRAAPSRRPPPPIAPAARSSTAAAVVRRPGGHVIGVR